MKGDVFPSSSCSYEDTSYKGEKYFCTKKTSLDFPGKFAVCLLKIDSNARTFILKIFSLGEMRDQNLVLNFRKAAISKCNAYRIKNKKGFCTRSSCLWRFS